MPASRPATTDTRPETGPKMTAQRSDTRLSAAGLLACLLALPACGVTEPEGGWLSGTWIGQADFTLSGDLIAPTSIILRTSEKRSITEGYTGEVNGTIFFEAGGQSVCAPVTGNHEYPDFSLRFALAGGELAGSYAGKATLGNCTRKIGKEDWCGMEGTFSTDDGAVSEALTLTRDATFEHLNGRPVCE